MRPGPHIAAPVRLVSIAAVVLAASLLLGSRAVVFGQAVPGAQLTDVAGLDLIVEDTSAGIASNSEQVVVATGAQGVSATVTLPPGAVDEGSTVTVGTIPDAAQQLLAAGVRAAGGLEILAAITVDGHTGNGLPLPTPFAERVSIGFELPGDAFPAEARPGNFELAAWDGTSWTLLVPAVTIAEDGSASVRDRVTVFSPIYAAMWVPSRIAGVARPNSVSLLVATVRSDAPSLVEALAVAGCEVRSIAIVRGSRWLTYIHGAPTAINERFPSAANAQEPFFVRCG